MDKKAWIVSVNMGYGHQRTAEPLKFLAQEGAVISANDYQGMPEKDKRIWESSRVFYESISRFKKVPLFGGVAFSIFDWTQRIKAFYPKRDLSGATFTQKGTHTLLERGWGKDLIDRLYPRNIPFISTFYNPAFMAEYFKYPGEIYCIVCDADIARIWAPFKPKTSRIKYFAPNERVVQRLKLYGVREENIILSGYPLPLENIGSRDMGVLKEDLKNRMLNLDPLSKYREKYSFVIREKLGKLPEKSDHPLTIIFAVGGAGAQKEMGIEIVRKLKKMIYGKKLKVILVAGTKLKIKEYFEREMRNGGLQSFLDKGMVEIIYKNNFEDYYNAFNLALRKSDILWTKPSELSFYSALGLPIIIAPTIGSQEDFNKHWLIKSGYGIEQEEIEDINDWLFDWINAGYLAEMAMEAYIEGEKLGALKIRDEVIKCLGS
jgi:hypothetical protein